MSPYFDTHGAMLPAFNVHLYTRLTLISYILTNVVCYKFEGQKLAKKISLPLYTLEYALHSNSRQASEMVAIVIFSSIIVRSSLQPGQSRRI